MGASKRSHPSGRRTPRLELRLPSEADRSRFVELFGNDEFMVFSGGALAADAAHARFDRMLANAVGIPFAKQPVIERATGVIVGYVGVDRIAFEGRERLELGYRLVPEARGKGYATEAATALLTMASETFDGELLGIIDPTNEPSTRVIAKLGFVFWKQALIDGDVCDIHRRQMGR